MSALFPTQEENESIARQQRREETRAKLEATAQLAKYLESTHDNLWCQIEFSEYGSWQQIYPDDKPWVGSAISNGQIHLILNRGDRNGMFASMREDMMFLLPLDALKAAQYLNRSAEKLKRSLAKHQEQEQ